MDFQSAFNLAIGLAGVLAGYILRSISDRLTSLQVADAALVEKIQKIEVTVAGQYVTHGDLEKLATGLYTKLDKISDKLDTKQDKS